MGRLYNLGLSRQNGYEYKAVPANIPVHISLFVVPTTAGYDRDTVFDLLRDTISTAAIPRQFTFGNVDAFLPSPNSNVVWIVVRVPSTMHQGFFNLTNVFSNNLGDLPRAHDQFKAHISLGTLTKNSPGAWNQQDVLNLKNTLNTMITPSGYFNISSILLSPPHSTGIGSIQLWPQ